MIRAHDEMIRPAEAVGEPSSWFKPEDYAALHAIAPYGDASAYGVAVAVTADDVVSDCKVTSWRADVMTPVVCSIVRTRGRFRHALAPDGSKRAGFVDMLLSFKLRRSDEGSMSGTPPPPSPPQPGWRPFQRRAAPAKPGDLVMKRVTAPGEQAAPPVIFVKISAEGELLECQIYTTSGSDAVDTEACSHLRTLRFVQAINADGVPAEMTTLFEMRF